VIWVTGASMVVLAGLVHLPRGAIAAIGLAMIAGHNLLDGIDAEDLGHAAWLWTLLHQPGLIEIAPQLKLFVLYNLVPWSGVMAAGYALGPVYRLDPAARRSFLIRTGAAVTAGFVVLRASNLYGDPAAWSMQGSVLGTVLSFIDCEKYPPSLLYLMMTLGPALILLALFERAHGALADVVTTFGRVPFFFYVVHVAFIHALAVGFAWITVGDMAGRSAPLCRKSPRATGSVFPASTSFGSASWRRFIRPAAPLRRSSNGGANGGGAISETMGTAHAVAGEQCRLGRSI
jgi:uncharacterized membrane protein